MENSPTLQSAEARTRVETRKLEPETLDAIELLLNQFSKGFGEIGSFELTDQNKLEQVWLLLTTRSFHSLRCAYSLLCDGYYGQSLMLTRAAAEDWLYCEDAKTQEATLSYLLDRKGKPPRFQEMATRLEKHLKEGWQGTPGGEGSYGLLSSFTHPNYRGIAALIDQETGELRLAPSYNETLFLVTSNYVLLRLMRTMEFLARLVPPQTQWLDEANQAIGMADKVREHNAGRMQALLKMET
jgi:hypothetical protein